jgi:hypothetical protein
MNMRGRHKFILSLIVAGIVFWIVIGGMIVHGLNEVASLEPGMIELHFPSGAIAYLRRQAYFGKPSDLYLSASGDFCKPFDSRYDYKLLDPIHGAPDSPLLISYSGDSIVVHAPTKPSSPWLSPPENFKVEFQKITAERYAGYASSKQSDLPLPTGWLRVDVPFGNNTCAP